MSYLGTKPANQVIDSTLIANGAVTADDLASGSVTPIKLSQPFTAGTAIASTSGTSIDFTNIPSWVKRITVGLRGVSTNGTSLMQIQLGAGSVTTSGYSGGAWFHTDSAIGAANYTSGLVLQNAVLAAANYSALFTFVTLGSNIWVGSGCTEGNTSSFGGGGTTSVTLSGTLDRVRITTVNGTDAFDAGTINILYE